MKCLFIALALLGLTVLTTKAEHYAVLVAGSNYFYNYRHQADIFHAYHALVEKGIEKKNIITFAYDDIAHDPSNPFPGKVFNKPTTGEGKDVYGSVKIDYSGNDVNSTNFLNSLKGDSKGTGGKKVLKSTSEDHVFIYFADHGAAGLIAFPNDYLYADDLIKTLNYMNEHKMYQRMVIYIEACESGSMFDTILAKNISIYTTTASNPDESSWATYCYPNDTINGTSVGSCLGDLYSVNFLENLDASKEDKETLLKQFKVIKKKTDLSHVMQYGDLTIDKEVIGDFEGNVTTKLAPWELEYDEEEVYDDDSIMKITSAVDSRYVKLAYLERRHEKMQSTQTKSELQEEFESIQRFDSTFAGLSSTFGLKTKTPLKDIDFDCLKMRVKMYEAMCGKFSDYGLKYVRYIHFTCAQGVDIYDYEAALINLCF